MNAPTSGYRAIAFHLLLDVRPDLSHTQAAILVDVAAELVADGERESAADLLGVAVGATDAALVVEALEAGL